MNRNTLLSVGLLACLMAGGLRAASAPDPDAVLNQFFQQYLETHFRQRPLSATHLGDHRFDAQLDDLSIGARRAWVEHARQTLKELPRRVDYRALSRAGQIDFEIFRHELVTDLWLAANTRPFEQDPRVYNQRISDSVFLVLAQSTLPRETNIAHALARMTHIPSVVAAARANLDRPPPSILETAIRQNRGSIAFYEGGILEFVGDSPQRQTVQEAGAKLAAVLKDYQQFLEQDLLGRATGDWRLGKAKFARKLELVLDAGLTADEVLAQAQAEFQRVTSELYVVSRQVWSHYFPRQALPPDDPEGRRATIGQVLAAVSREHGEGQDLVRDARATVANLKAFIRAQDILRLPEPDRCQVIEMPEFQRGNSLAYLNSAPPLDPNATSMYAVSPPGADWPPERVQSLLEEYNRHMLQILTIHEAYPGHYVQLEYSNRAGSPIRRVLQSGPFIEGWAVYTEQTMLDQGYGEGNLPLRLMQLKFYLRAVVNAILDHQMHCRNLTDAQAMELLVQGGFQSEEEARLKIVRAKQSSVQLSTYFVGRMAHYRLRQTLQRELGEAFDLGRYHEAVLAHGSVPVKYLPELVRARLREPR
ncbi:MAG: DUF885 domain-containing protein [Verrucomicrobia bacterium]|nr:DUF885 domain-containing protein [Verrucomicrobiota bacterium]